MPEPIETEEITTEHIQPQHVTRTTRKVIPNEVIDEAHSVKGIKKKRSLFRVYQVIWYILTVMEIILGFRFFLKFLGANPESGFANFIYVLSAPLATPFIGIFQPSLVSATAIIEWSTLFAMGVYALLAYILTELIPIIKPLSPEEVDHTLEVE